MKKFDKKLLISIILLGVILCVALYFFTKEGESSIDLNNLYVSSNNILTEDKLEEIIIHIDGEVLNPGIIKLAAGSRIADAIEKSGGLTDNANISNVNLAYQLSDGQKVHIPNVNETDENEITQHDAGTNIIKSGDDKKAGTININTATQSELESLSGIGSSTAAKIIDYRNKNGKFKNIQDIMNVSGIGEAKFNSIKDYISI